MNAVVVGYGSIGKRHTRILEDMGLEVSVVSERDIYFEKRYGNVEEAVKKEDPNYIVISNSTHRHIRTLRKISSIPFDGKLLIEKPVTHKNVELPSPLPDETFVAYNMRFHPLLQKLRDEILGSSIVSAHVYAGQYMPDWRPERDYRKSYSAQKEKGGGVIRDLSHELDYVRWMFGGWESTASMGGQFSHLDIDSDDVYALLISTERCPVVSLQINYVDKIRHRIVIINTQKKTLKANIEKDTFESSKGGKSKYKIDIDKTYKKEHKGVINERSKYRNDLCTLREGIETVENIEKAENINIIK